ncbi:hypothetical protein YB2330_002581 [Saitoella coloradoensis]
MLHPVLPALLSTLFITAVLFLLLAPTLGLADEISSSIDAACVASLSSLAGNASASGMSVGAGGGAIYACYNILAFTPPTFIADLRLFETPSSAPLAANASTNTDSPTIEIVWPSGITGDSVTGGAALTRRSSFPDSAPPAIPNWKVWKRQDAGTTAAAPMPLTNKWVFTGTITDENLLSQPESGLKNMMLPAVNLVSRDGGKMDLSSSSGGSMASYVFGVMADTTSGSAIIPTPPAIVAPSSSSSFGAAQVVGTPTPTSDAATAAVATGLLTDSSVSLIGANGPTNALVPTPAPSNSIPAVDTSVATFAMSALGVDASSSTDTPAAELPSTSAAGVAQASSTAVMATPSSTSTAPATAFTPSIAAAVASSSSPSSSAQPLALADTAQPQSAPAAALQATIATPFVLPGTSLGIVPIGTYVFSAWTGIFGLIVGAGFWRKWMFRGQYRRRVHVNVEQGGGGVVGNGLRSEFSM